MKHTGKLSKMIVQVGLTLVVMFFLPISFTTALADQVTDVYGVSAPEDAWAYFKFPNASHGFDTTYVPTRSDVSNSRLLGFLVTPGNGEWGAFSEDKDTVFVFATVVRSPNPVTIPLVWNGDDGHSVFVNGVFVGGGGFNEQVAFDLTVTPGVPVKLELVGYNGPGPWAFKLIRRDTKLPVTSTPGVTIDACTGDVPREICGVLFATFTARVKLVLGPLASDDEFKVKGTFTLRDDSDGINLLTEDVRLQVGAFSTIIPANSFTQKHRGKFRFEGAIDNVKLEAVIRPLRHRNFEFTVEGEGANLTGTLTPLTVTLSIGDDRGRTRLTTGNAQFEEADDNSGDGPPTGAFR